MSLDTNLKGTLKEFLSRILDKILFEKVEGGVSLKVESSSYENTIDGSGNVVIGKSSTVSGRDNYVTGEDNIVTGDYNNVEGYSNSSAYDTFRFNPTSKIESGSVSELETLSGTDYTPHATGSGLSISIDYYTGEPKITYGGYGYTVGDIISQYGPRGQVFFKVSAVEDKKYYSLGSSYSEKMSLFGSDFSSIYDTVGTKQGEGRKVYTSSYGEVIELTFTPASWMDLCLSLGVTGNYNHVEGVGNSVNGQYSHVGGSHNGVFADFSFAHGSEVYVNGNYSIGVGDRINVNGIDSAAFGSSNAIDSSESFSAGHANYIHQNSSYSAAFGNNNEIGEDCECSSVFSGHSNKISDGVKNSVIIGCKNVTADESSTTYVQNLSINYCTGASAYNKSAKIFVTDEGKLKAVVGGREYFIALSETDPTA